MRFWHEVDGLLLRQAAKEADAVRAAFVKSIPVDDIVNRWADNQPDGSKISPADARTWALNNVQIPEKPLRDALHHVYATGWVIGDDASTAAYAHAKLGIDKAAPTGPQISAAINTDWNNWKPGNRPAAALVRPPGGLKKLLDNADVAVKEVNTTTLNRIGTLLADSLNSGASYDSLARNLLRDTITSSVIKDSARASMIAVTEMSRALNTSTVDNYGTFGVEMVEWLAIDTGTCEICPANEAQGPIKLGDVFDSGDEAPPAHPNCRCTILPVVDEGTPLAAEGAPADDFSTDEMEISDVADHGIEDVMAAPAEFKPLDWSDFPGVRGATDAEEQALKDYSVEWHRPMNAAMRGVDIADPNTRFYIKNPVTRDRVITNNENLKALMARHTLPENATVQRYMDAAELGISEAALIEANFAATVEKLVGSVVESKPFLSTSAMDYRGLAFTDRSIRMILNLPAGTRAVRNTLAEYFTEREVLIDAGSKYIITNVYKSDKHVVVEALLGEQ